MKHTIGLVRLWRNSSEFLSRWRW